MNVESDKRRHTMLTSGPPIGMHGQGCSNIHAHVCTHNNDINNHHNNIRHLKHVISFKILNK